MTDLGFVHRARKNGEIEIRHHGRLAATLRGEAARRFVADIADADDDAAQELMARLTGNYRRGNERTARSHPRNRSGR